MAALNPAIEIKLNVDSAGATKGLGTVSKDLDMMDEAAGRSSAGLEKTQGMLSKIGSALGGVLQFAGGILLANTIFKISSGILSLASSAVDFQTQMANVNSIAQLSTTQLDALTSSVLKIAEDPRIVDSPATLAAGLYQIYSSGFHGADALNILQQASMGASAGLTDTATSATVVVGVLNAYQRGADQAAHVSDQLFQIVNDGIITYGQLANALGTALPGAAALGVGMDDLGASIVQMTKSGIDADTATTDLRGVFNAFIKPTTDMTAALNAAGYASGEQLIQTKGLAGAYQFLQDATGGSSEKLAALLGDTRAATGAQAILNQGMDKYNAELANMQGASDGVGAAQRALEKQMKSIGFQTAVARKNFQILAALLLDKLSPVLFPVLKHLNDFFNILFRLNNNGVPFFDAAMRALHSTLRRLFGPEAGDALFGGFQTLVTIGKDVVRVFQKIMTVVEPVLSFIVKHFDIIGPAILGAAVALKAFAVAEAIVEVVSAILEAELSPLLLIMLAIAAAGALFAVAYAKNWLGIRDITNKVAKDVMRVLDDFAQVVKYLGGVLTGKSLSTKNLEMLPVPLRKLVLVLAQFVAPLSRFISAWKKAGALAAFRTIPKDLASIGSALSQLLRSVGLNNLADVAQKDFQNIAAVLRDVINIIDDLVHGRWGQVWIDFKNLAHDELTYLLTYIQGFPALIFDVFGTSWGGLLGLVKGWIDDFVNMFKSLLGIGSPSTVFIQIGSDIIAGLIQGLSNGIAAVLNWFGKLANSITGALSNAANWLIDTGAAILGGLLAGITTGWDAVAGWLAGIAGFVISAVGGYNDVEGWLESTGKGILQGLRNGIGTKWGSLSAWLGGLPSRIYGVINDALGDALSDLGDIGKSLLGAVWDGFRSVWDGAGNTASNLSQWLTGLPQKIYDAIKAGVDAVKDWLGPFRPILDAIDTVKKAWDKVSGLFGSGSGSGAGAGNGTNPGPPSVPAVPSSSGSVTLGAFDDNNTLSDITTWVSNVSAQFALLDGYLVFAGAGTGPATTDITMSPPAWSTQDAALAVQEITSWSESVTAAMVAEWTTQLHDAHDYGYLIGNAIDTELQGTYPAIDADFKAITDSLTTHVGTDALHDAHDYGFLVGNALWSEIDGAVQEIDRTLGTVPGIVKTWFGTGKGGVQAAVKGLSGSLVSALTQPFDDAVTGPGGIGLTMASVSDIVLGSLGEPLPHLANDAGWFVGYNIGAGLDSGINGWATTIATDAANLVNNAIAAAQSAANAHSPSRKTMALGSDMGEGLSLGIGQWRKPVAASLASLIDIPAGGAYGGRSMRGGSDAGGIHLHGDVKIEVSGAGDPEAVGDAVMRKFARHMRRRLGLPG